MVFRVAALRTAPRLWPKYGDERRLRFPGLKFVWLRALNASVLNVMRNCSVTSFVAVTARPGAAEWSVAIAAICDEGVSAAAQAEQLARQIATLPALKAEQFPMPFSPECRPSYRTAMARTPATTIDYLQDCSRRAFPFPVAALAAFAALGACWLFKKKLMIAVVRGTHHDVCA